MRPTNNPFWTIPELARALGVSPDTVRREAAARNLLDRKLGSAYVLVDTDVAVLRSAIRPKTGVHVNE